MRTQKYTFWDWRGKENIQIRKKNCTTYNFETNSALCYGIINARLNGRAVPFRSLSVRGCRRRTMRAADMVSCSRLLAKGQGRRVIMGLCPIPG